ncbi:transposase [Arsenophonus endosymbiont of Bemisia tabaci]|uniref:transposase n=1 Tax=Arsenophonus endosymbiont of Bemisia tabaci TaxID=536059 RepID=UPI00175C0F8D|nr:transposase [Arsenophonus endosymbiont of Bemisia tabaci]CAA2930127.1 hypothetical protein ARSQ2_01244 [Arsenophonus endosymbiont of Bemisia tabaci Q2]
MEKNIYFVIKIKTLSYTSSESRRKHSTNVSTKKQQYEYEKEGKHIVFIDEIGFSHDIPRTHGYFPKGQRCVGRKNCGAKGRTNVIGALLGTMLFAIGLFDININSDVFYAWVTQVLILVLPKNSVIMMDNATFHKKQSIQQVIIDAGHMVEYWPTYSRDLNPIEHIWGKAKCKKKSARMRHRYFVRTQYSVIKIKSLSYIVWKSVRVVTTETLAKGYGATA